MPAIKAINTNSNSLFLSLVQYICRNHREKHINRCRQVSIVKLYSSIVWRTIQAKIIVINNSHTRSHGSDKDRYIRAKEREKIAKDHDSPATILPNCICIYRPQKDGVENLEMDWYIFNICDAFILFWWLPRVLRFMSIPWLQLEATLLPGTAVIKSALIVAARLSFTTWCQTRQNVSKPLWLRFMMSSFFPTSQ
jgi:hypothetical protein